MLELLIFGAGAATGALALALPYTRARNDRDVLQAAKDSLAVDVEALTNRVTVLRGDNIAQQSTIDTLRTGHDRLVDERDDLKRQLGRIEAERRAEMQKAVKTAQPRDPKTGRMLPNPNAKRPRKSRAKDAPIACG
jgi:uncharacterized caspase-like protein